MNVLESMSNRRINEVPNLDALVATTGYEMAACWMEVNCTYPIFVALTGHDVFLIFQVPDLPGAIVTSCGYNLLLCVKGHASDTPWLGLIMSIDLLVQSHSLHKVIKSL